jgi:hypothetical protein
LSHFIDEVFAMELIGLSQAEQLRLNNAPKWGLSGGACAVACDFWLSDCLNAISATAQQRIERLKRAWPSIMLGQMLYNADKRRMIRESARVRRQHS